jgi:hypothetical protein
MRKLLGVAALVGVAMWAWRAWQQRQEDAHVWASGTDRVR